MANSSNMGLPIPVVGNTIGPTYAYDVNNSLTLIDSHDHSPGKGVQITPAGIDINDTVDFQGNQIINLLQSVFTAQSMPSNTLQSLSVAPGSESPPLQDLWYTDSAGNKVQLTSNGLVNATIASIPGESYAAGTFFWKQGTGSTVPANFDIGSITIRPNVALTTFGVTLAPSAGISSAYTLTLPLLPPSVTSLVSITTAGVMLSTPPDNVTLEIASNTLRVKDGGIGTAELADGGVTAAKLDPAVLEWNSITFTTSGTFIVPASTGQLFIEAYGGGGGGGGGGRNAPATTPGGGGGGGGGNEAVFTILPVVPGDSIGFTVGSGGAGGAHAAISGSNGSPGNSGSATVVAQNGTQILKTSFGRAGGAGGNPSGGAGASGPTLTHDTIDLHAVGGGNGAMGASTTTQQPGGINPQAPSPSTAGSTIGGFAGGGGGGGNGFNTGGFGGNGATTSVGGVNGQNAPAPGAGGGGGGGGLVSPNPAGGDGGSGATGAVIIKWLGEPS